MKKVILNSNIVSVKTLLVFLVACLTSFLYKKAGRKNKFFKAVPKAYKFWDGIIENMITKSYYKEVKNSKINSAVSNKDIVIEDAIIIDIT